MRNLLSIENPALCVEWSDRNLPLTPDMVTAGSSKKVWWRGACGHEWQALVKNRAGRGCGCPVCSGKLIVPGENDLQSKAPDIIKEWDFEKNNEIRPDQVGVQSNYKVFWICARGHSFAARIADRVKGSGCPFCCAEKIRFRKDERIKRLSAEKEQAHYLKSMRMRKREKERFKRELPGRALLYYSKKARLRLLQNDEEKIGIPIQYYFPDISGAIELNSKRRSYSTIQEICENRLLAKSRIRLVRIIDPECEANDECYCLYREDRSTKSLEWAIRSAFSILGVNADVDLKRDYKGILGGGSSKQ